jgi:transcriptional regulator with XRE-family HTH domain
MRNLTNPWSGTNRLREGASVERRDHGVELGRWVRARRESLKLTTEQLWERTDLEGDFNYISQLENGRRKKLPDFEILSGLAQALNVTVTEVLRGAGILPVDVEQPPEHAPGSATMHALVDMIDWTTNPANRENVEGLLRLILERQQAATSGRAPAGSRSS